MAERLYRIQKAAELSGVSEELIRAWERRYGVLAPERSEGGHRLYSHAEVELLRRLRELTEEGTPIGAAARLVPELRREIARADEDRARDQEEATALERWRREIVGGAERMEQARIERALDEALAALPAPQVFDEVIVPCLREVGDRWHAGALDVAQEHLATQSLRARVLSLLHGAPEGSARHVVVACFPDEQHEIGALGAALRLRYDGIRVTYLGQRTPAAELGRMVRAVEPAAVALSAVTDPGAEEFERLLSELRSELPQTAPVIVGGRAAQLYADAVARAGFRLFVEGGWDEVFRTVESWSRD